MKHHAWFTASVLALTYVLAAPGTAEAAKITVSQASITAGKLVIRGRTSKAGTTVTLNGTAYKVRSKRNRNFAFNLLYLPPTCQITLTAGTAKKTVLVGNCGPKGEKGDPGLTGATGSTGSTGSSGGGTPGPGAVTETNFIRSDQEYTLAATLSGQTPSFNLVDSTSLGTASWEKALLAGQKLLISTSFNAQYQAMKVDATLAYSVCVLRQNDSKLFLPSGGTINEAAISNVRDNTTPTAYTTLSLNETIIIPTTDTYRIGLCVGNPQTHSLKISKVRLNAMVFN